jgi:AcrR family transcriptional regulator
MGLRDRKKEQTRRRIAEAAHRLFGEHGFEKVTVAQVAQAAEVAEATLFNYFPTKEDLFYSGLEMFGARLVDAVRGRPAGTPALAAVRATVLGGGGQLDRIADGDRAALEQARTTARIISASPALRARERQVLADVAADLAAALAPDTGDEVVAQALANALMGVHGALIEYVRHRLLSDDHPETIVADLQRVGGRAFDLLEHGLADVARAAPPA